MNKHLYSILLIVFCFIANGCNDYLESEPYSFTAVESFYKTEKEIELALGGCYNTLIAGNIQGEGPWATFAAGMQLMLGGGTDEYFTRDGFSRPDFSPFGLASYNPENEQIRKNWFFLFAGVNRTNHLLEQIDAIEMNESRKQEVIGEARFLRGLIYMYLAMMYGGVPVYTDPVQDPQAPRASLEVVFQQVIDDFTFAYSTLPDRATMPGRANKWSAGGFLAKVYTYLGSAKQHHVGDDLNFNLNSFEWVNADQCYQDAKTITADIIENSGYRLIERYDNLFRETTASWQYQECLFTVEASGTQTSGADYGIWRWLAIPTGNSVLYGGGAGWFRPSAELYYKYVAIDKRRDHNLTGTYNQTSTMETVDGVGYYVPTGNVIPRQPRYSAGKFRYKDPATKTINVAWSEGNYPLLRYADVLLMHAEALYFTGNEADARKQFTAVRARSVAENATADDLDTLYYKEDFVDELLDERSRELCFESWRRIDLIRFGALGEAINALSSDRNFGRWNTVTPIIKENWVPHRIWFPIPRLQTELNPSLEQNPGY